MRPRDYYANRREDAHAKFKAADEQMQQSLNRMAEISRQFKETNKDIESELAYMEENLKKYDKILNQI